MRIICKYVDSLAGTLVVLTAIAPARHAQTLTMSLTTESIIFNLDLSTRILPQLPAGTHTSTLSMQAQAL